MSELALYWTVIDPLSLYAALFFVLMELLFVVHQ